MCMIETHSNTNKRVLPFLYRKECNKFLSEYQFRQTSIEGKCGKTVVRHILRITPHYCFRNTRSLVRVTVIHTCYLFNALAPFCILWTNFKVYSLILTQYTPLCVYSCERSLTFPTHFVNFLPTILVCAK